MKVKDLIAVAAISLLAACEAPYRATNTTVVVAPSGTESAFIAQYPSASNIVWMQYNQDVVVPIDWELAGWTLDEGDYQVRFNMDNEDYYAWYDENGNWIGTAYVVRDYTELPAVVSNTLNNQFTGYAILSAHKEFQKDRMAYEVELKNDNTKIKLLVDSNGNIIKQKNKQLN